LVAPIHFDDCFPIPKLVVFSAHMIDAPDRRNPDFPWQRGRRKGTAGAAIGCYECRQGFARLVPARTSCPGSHAGSRGTIHLVLPWPAEEFEKTSVAIEPGGEWVERFHKVLAQAASIRSWAKLYMPGSATGFEYCNLGHETGWRGSSPRSLDLE